MVSALGITSSGGGFSQHAKADWVAGNTTFTRVSGGSEPVASWNNTFCGRFGVIDAIGCVTPGASVTPSPTAGVVSPRPTERIRPGFIDDERRFAGLNWDWVYWLVVGCLFFFLWYRTAEDDYSS